MVRKLVTLEDYMISPQTLISRIIGLQAILLTLRDASPSEIIDTYLTYFTIEQEQNNRYQFQARKDDLYKRKKC